MRLGRRFVHELSDTIDFYAGYNAFLADEGPVPTRANAAV